MGSSLTAYTLRNGMKWKLDQEEYYFKVYDEQDQLAGYFQPDFGEIQPPEKEEEIIREMLKREDHVYGGLLYVPMVKLNLFDDQLDTYDLEHIVANLDASIEKTERWKECIKATPSITFARARKSHTDPDMLSVLLGVKFTTPARLNKKELIDALQPILDTFHERELL